MRRDVSAGKDAASRVRCLKSAGWFCAPHGLNNPVKYVDPTGHFTCQIGNDGADAGVTEAACEDWINQALAILSLTDTGSKIVEAFWAADASMGPGGIPIIVGGTVEIFMSFGPHTDPRLVFEGNINDMLNSNANFILGSMYLPPDMILSNPMEPGSDWKFVATFGHESIHAAQGFWNVYSDYGEAEAHYYTYDLTNEMNGLITSYERARDASDPKLDRVPQHHLASGLRTDMSNNATTIWNDPNVIADYGKRSDWYEYTVDGIWGDYHGGAFP